jgi:AmiR/NasT family two-component response regulator
MLAVRIASAVQLAQDLEEAMKSRTAIDLAVGIIMGQQRCSQDEAFAILTRAASNRNEKLRKVAAELVEHLSGSGARTHFEK